MVKLRILGGNEKRKVGRLFHRVSEIVSIARERIERGDADSSLFLSHELPASTTPVVIGSTPLQSLSVLPSPSRERGIERGDADSSLFLSHELPASTTPVVIDSTPLQSLSVLPSPSRERGIERGDAVMGKERRITRMKIKDEN